MPSMPSAWRQWRQADAAAPAQVKAACAGGDAETMTIHHPRTSQRVSKAQHLAGDM